MSIYVTDTLEQENTEQSESDHLRAINKELHEELLQCRSKLALAAENAAGDDELIAELVKALQALIDAEESVSFDEYVSKYGFATGYAVVNARAALTKAGAA